jgi:hypothetical protein
MLSKIFVVAVLLALPSAAIANDVRVDYDRHNDFTKYRTFDIEVGPLLGDDGEVDVANTLAETRLRAAIGRELQTRGLERTDTQADLVIRVSGRDTERTAIVSSGFGPYFAGYPYRGYWGRRSWRYGYWGSPFYYGYPDVWTRRYLEGSLTVDVIERGTGSLVYRAQVIDEVAKDREKQMSKAMEKAFKKFPVRVAMK